MRWRVKELEHGCRGSGLYCHFKGHFSGFQQEISFAA